MARLRIPDHIVIALGQGPLNGLQVRRNGLKTSGNSAPGLVTQPTPPTRLSTAPIAPLTTSTSPPEAPSAKSPLEAPRALTRRARPKRPRPPARPPLNTWPRFKAAHEEDSRRLAVYLELGHKNHVRLSHSAQQDIERASALYLPANNHAAHIDYARIAVAHVTRFTDTLPRSTPVFWVTLIAERYTVGLDRAGVFDPYPLQQWVRAVLPGCSFVGMVEAALYGNVGLVKQGLKKAVSWHVHLVLWGVAAEKMKKLRDLINKRTRTMIPGVKAAHFRRIEPEDIEGQVLYMLKAPVNEYRIYAMRETVTDSTTGEITTPATGRFGTNKYQLGPGDLAHMVNLLSGKTLDQLTFAAGQGRAILGAINSESGAAYRAAQRRERAREAARQAATLSRRPGRSRRAS